MQKSNPFNTVEFKAKIEKGEILLRDVIGESRHNIEKALIAVVLDVYNWNRWKAARSLNVSYRSLLYKIVQYKLDDKPHSFTVRRRYIPEMVRNYVMKRDGFKCVYCGSGVIEKLIIDHKFPFSKNGDTEIDNLQTLCIDCNVSKGTATCS